MLIMPHVVWKVLKWPSIETLPSLLNLGRIFVVPLGNATGLTPRFNRPMFYPHGGLTTMFGDMTCKGWIFKWEGTIAFNRSKDCTNSEKGDYFSGELGLQLELLFFFWGLLKLGMKVKFFRGSKFSSRISFSLSPLVYLLEASSISHFLFKILQVL